MKPVTRTAAIAFGLVVSFTLAQSCSDPASDDSSGDKATIDEAGVATGIAEMSTIFAVCQGRVQSGGRSQQPHGGRSAPNLLARILEMRKTTGFQEAFRTSSFSANAPADKLGECGGRATYASYNHSSGTTTATYEYQNYCNVDYGDRQPHDPQRQLDLQGNRDPR